MLRILRKCTRWFVDYMQRTLKNKVIAITFIGVGVGGLLLGKDATFLVFSLILGVPLFFTTKDAFA